MTTILIVDDNDPNRTVLARLLARTGFVVVEAADGASALEQVRAERPDLALVDLLMPVVDGFEFVRRLRQEEGPHAGTPVVFFTAAYIPSEVMPIARQCGVTHVLARPASYQEILRVINEALEMGPQAAAPIPEGDYRLELLRLLTSTLTQNFRSVIPSLIEYLDTCGEPASPPGEGDETADT